jgi:hypothetical protein
VPNPGRPPGHVTRTPRGSEGQRLTASVQRAVLRQLHATAGQQAGPFRRGAACGCPGLPHW